MLLKLLKWLLMLVAVLSILALFGIWYIGAWNILFPSSSHDSTRPELPSDFDRPTLLIFSKTNQFRHKDGIPAGEALLTYLAERRGWKVFTTENGAVFNDAQLSRFTVVVFNSATGDMLSDDQEAAFERWLTGGGGWIGIHAAGDGSHAGWQWYMDNLLGAQFTAHIMGPQTQSARVENERPEHPVMAGLPAYWDQEEEWYSWVESPRPRGFIPLATVDESSYDPFQRMLGSNRDLRMGDHPVVWINCPGRGRSLYTAMGHWAAAFEVTEYRQLLDNALGWAAGEGPSGCSAD